MTIEDEVSEFEEVSAIEYLLYHLTLVYVCFDCMSVWFVFMHKIKKNK